MKLFRTAVVILGLAAYMLAFWETPLPSLQGQQPTPPSRLAVLFAIVGNCNETFLSAWFGNPPQMALGERLPILAAAALITAWAAAVGWLFLAAIRVLDRLTRLETAVFSTAIGFNLLGTWTLMLGLCGRLNRMWLIITPLALTLMAFLFVWRRREDCAYNEKPNGEKTTDHPQNTRQAEKDIRWFGCRWLWLAAPFVAVIVLAAMLPPIEFDVCEYHLQAPKEFFQQGRISFLPHNVYANMAMGTEMLSLLGMSLVGDWQRGSLVGKTVIAVFTLLCSGALFAAGRRLHSTTAGVVAALTYVSIPWIFNVSTFGLVEGAAACYLFLSLYALLLSRDGSLGFVILTGMMAGAAVATKYPAVLFVFLPVAAALLLVGRAKRDFGVKLESKSPNPQIPKSLASHSPLYTLLIFLLATTLACGGWFAKNWALTGNPTYPLLYSVFGGKTWTPAKDAQWNHVHRPHDFSPGRLENDLKSVALTSNWLSPLVIPLTALAFLGGAAVRRQTRLAWWLLADAAWVVATWWLFTHRIDRFWIPIFPVLALLAGMGACWSEERWWRWCFSIFLAVGLATNFVMVANGWLWPNAWFVSYSRMHNQSPWTSSWHAYLNDHCHGRVLTIGDAAVFSLEPPSLYSTCFDDCVFEQLVRGQTPQKVKETFKLQHIAYVFVDWSEIRRYRSPGNYGFTNFVQPTVFAELVQGGVLQLQKSDEAGALYRVVDRPPIR